jgi:hypothetical protein
MPIEHARTASPSRRRTAVAAATAALALGAVLTAGATAQAAPAAQGPALRVSATAPAPGSLRPMAVLSFSHTLTVSPYATVTCTLNPSNPFRYYGGPYGGGEEGLSSVQCSYTVTEIDTQVGLYRGTSLVANSAVRTALSTNLDGADTEYPVSAGSYQTGAVAAVQFTDGYVYNFPEAYSSVVSITS